ncbi:MAG: hypothetical protein M1819_006604 [Sarea resinae]|nr:MAG: hypothetical protein M1819_006604 [Sarea resinae]
MNFDNLKDQVSNLSLYDLKAGVRKVQNVVMNYTEMEAKVREATNNEPWGASSTLMQEISNGTYNYQLLNEIMPMIYKRFTEKAAEEWRQIYKALQLLEFLIKNGSERVIDDARSHLSLLKMLRQFHFIDPNGKDQGINVRNRAKELAELLSDVDRIRSERKKARSTRNKYGGVEGGMGLGGGMSGGGGGGRYGGFGSEDNSYGGFSGGVYGDGGGFGGSSGYDDPTSRSTSRGNRFEEYDEYDEGAVAAPGNRQADVASSRRAPKREEARPAPPKKEPEVDLFSFGDEDLASNGNGNGKQPARPSGEGFGALQSGGADDDDFDDFQSAAPSQPPPPPSKSGILPAPPAKNASSTQFAAPQPVSGSQGVNLTDLVGFASISPAPSNASTTTAATSAFSPPPMAQSAARPSGYQAAHPNYFTSVAVQPAQASQPVASPGVQSPISPTATGRSATSGTSKPAAGGDAFGSLWSSASVGIRKTGTPTQTQGPNLASMAKEKASAGIWGAATATGQSPGQKPGQTQSQPKLGGGLDDLLG